MRQADKVIDLVAELMDFAELVGPNEHNPGYNSYRIEFPIKHIGFIIVAKKDPRECGGNWHIHGWSTYNV
jgi:hypothetical protein